LTHRESQIDGVAMCGALDGDMVGVWGDERFPVTCAKCQRIGRVRGLFPLPKETKP
jgi:hypothetical protein